MSEPRDKTSTQRASGAPALDTRALDARYAGAFWDGVESEVEAIDASDFEDFLDADALPIEPDAGFRRQLSGYLKDLVRARFAH